MSELYEVMLNSQSIFESFTDEQRMYVSFLVTLSFFVFGFGPTIVSWIIRLFKRLIENRRTKTIKKIEETRQ